MSDLNEEYQEQVLEDLSDIKESVTTDSGYQEKVLDDLDDIKDSVSQEQEYYDEKYQKKVLGSLRSIEKSVTTDDLTTITYSKQINSYYFYATKNSSGIYFNKTSTMLDFYVRQYDISDLYHIYLYFSNNSFNNTYPAIACLSNDDYSSITAGLTITSDNIFENFTKESFFDFYNTENFNYLYVANNYRSYPVEVYYNASDLPSTDETVTSGSAVIAEGIDTLIQITTFQGFASALLTGILLFLVFVKGLRR